VQVEEYNDYILLTVDMKTKKNTFGLQHSYRGKEGQGSRKERVCVNVEGK